QGFNFSPRFRCKYDEEKNELEIIDKDKTGEFYPKNFFGDNINITAIVGENGSGKSSILELLPYGEKMQKSNYLLFKKGDEYILLKQSSKEIKINKDFKEKIEVEDSRKLNFAKSSGIKLFTFDTDFTKENFTDKNIIQYLANLIKFGHSFKEEYLENNNKKFNLEKYKHSSNILLYILRDELINLNSFFIPTYIKITNQNKSHSNLKIEEVIEILKKKEDLKELVDKLEKNKDLLKQFKYNQKITISDANKIEILFELPIQEYFYIDFYNEKDISFSEFSHGERNFYNHFLFLMFINKNYLKFEKNENTFFLIDEPDTTFHPNWQKKYINQLLNIYKNYKKNIHFIIASHSPFILSDLPKENIIFLEKGKQVYPFEDGKQTFGANIHTLLSHGFFMKDGLMGEFAKDKIQSIIKYHEDIEKKEILEADKIEYKTKKQREFWQIQSIIGDDYLKQVIKNHLVEIEKIVLGNDEAKKEEVKRLKAQIELLEKGNVKNKIFIKFRR
ncbi:MAG: AAA family ATPase, partial [Candidatus Altimarinota bacterium]